MRGRAYGGLTGGPVASGRLVRGFVSSSLPECFLGEARKERSGGFWTCILESFASGKLVRGLCQFRPPRSRRGEGHGSGKLVRGLCQFKPPRSRRGEGHGSGKLVRGLCQFKPPRSRRGEGHGVDVGVWQLRHLALEGRVRVVCFCIVFCIAGRAEYFGSVPLLPSCPFFFLCKGGEPFSFFFFLSLSLSLSLSFLLFCLLVCRLLARLSFS